MTWSELSPVDDDESRTRTGLERLHLPAQLLRLPEIVSVQERQQLPLRVPYADVARGGDPPVPLPDVLQIATIAAQLGDGAVRRPIVDNNQLEITIRLRQHAANACSDVRSLVVGRNNDAHGGTHHDLRSSAGDSPSGLESCR